ncbi:MAG: hypothetical protein ACJAYH_001003 [Celeribacter sp.]|jgi:hypothetical protein
MINTNTNTNQAINTAHEFGGAIVLKWDAHAAKTASRHANHNLTAEARSTNVVALGGYHDNGDFRPDLGARLAQAA